MNATAFFVSITLEIFWFVLIQSLCHSKWRSWRWTSCWHDLQQSVQGHYIQSIVYLWISNSYLRTCTLGFFGFTRFVVCTCVPTCLVILTFWVGFFSRNLLNFLARSIISSSSMSQSLLSHHPLWFWKQLFLGVCRLISKVWIERTNLSRLKVSMSLLSSITVTFTWKHS